MLGPRFPPLIPPFGPDERLEVDEAGNVNWRLQWMKELAHLQELTQENEKAGVSEEWFKLMFLRVRGALLGHIPGEASIPPNELLPAASNQQSQQ
jgi:forkhead box protein J2/3